MSLVVFLVLGIFIAGYAGITLEHNLRVNKAALAMGMGGLMWMLVPFAHAEHAREILTHSAAEIFEITIFLLCAMSLVEVLVHYQFFDLIRGKILKMGLDDRKQFLIISVLTFFLSGILDNLTITIVMVQIARKFFKGETLVKATAGIVVAANAGGAFSPLGDVTTIMLWLAGKFSALEIITRGFLPSLAMTIVPTFVISRMIKPRKVSDEKTDVITSLSRSEMLVVGLTFGSFTLPLVMSFLGLPPYIGLLTGLGIVWLVIDVLKQFSARKTHLEVALEELVQKTDIASIKFFIGILLAVSALNSLGLLEQLSQILFGPEPTFNRIVGGNVLLGIISSILDNVPLTAIAIEALKTDITGLWVLLAVAVGTGGSLLVIGSAAGVIAMGMVKELNFVNYMKIATIPVLAGYLLAMAVWYVQYQLTISAGIIPH